MRTSTDPAPPADTAAEFDSIFAARRHGYATEKSITPFLPPPPTIDFSPASARASALATLAAYVRARRAPSLRGAAAAAWDAALLTDVLAGTFNPDWFAPAALNIDNAWLYTPHEFAASDITPPCGIDPLRAPSGFGAYLTTNVYDPPPTLSTGPQGSCGWHGATIANRWRDTQVVVRQRRYTLPRRHQGPTVAPLLFRVNAQWRAQSTISLDRSPAIIPGSWVAARYWFSPGSSSRFNWFGYADPRVAEPPSVVTPGPAPAPVYPPADPPNTIGATNTWEASRSWTAIQTPHPWLKKFPTMSYFWVISWIRPSFGVPCPPCDIFDARVHDTVTIWQAKP